MMVPKKQETEKRDIVRILKGKDVQFLRPLMKGTFCPNPIFSEFLVFLASVWTDFPNLSQKNQSFGKLDHMISPLTPGQEHFAKSAFFGHFGDF